MSDDGLVFDKWNNKKKIIHKDKKSFNIKIGTIYWVNIGKNIGSETYGKGDSFSRPVLVINKIYIKDFISAFIGIPISSKTKNKTGYLYHKFTTTNGKNQVALLSQIRAFDTKRVISFYNGRILKNDFETIKNKLKYNIIN
ncbi:type II toxin-antitoxin system PemK/MazF family toxin [Campylobacter sputorum]|uniref:type II toxin-antitoxin system PemK/MazF family toxin n=1 Tax=Campylobacter sputorum TaxID=206 RepID=UPI00053BE2F9|nr:type II toxin-antitoxin system PemK/MazF family toxin [Campylobacter sputorum]